MVLIKPIANVILNVQPDIIMIQLARYPDPELLADIYSITDNPGIQITETGFDSAASAALGRPIMKELPKERLCYAIYIPPIYKTEDVAKAIEAMFIKDHGFTVWMPNPVFEPLPIEHGHRGLFFSVH
jgi:hypothetical protein